MTPTELDLARRLVAAERWRWMRGMRCVGERSGVFSNIEHGMIFFHETGCGYITMRPLGEHVPDLSDPATQGCLWAMLREDAGLEAHAAYDADEYPPPGIPRGRWDAYVPGTRSKRGNDGWIEAYDVTLGEALARALLAAWGAEDVEAGQ